MSIFEPTSPSGAGGAASSALLLGLDDDPASPAASRLATRGESTIGRAHGSCEARSRREEEVDVDAHRRRRATKRSPATPMGPSGSGGAGASAVLALLDDVQRHRLRRAALHLPPRRSERGLLYFHHGLLGGPSSSTCHSSSRCSWQENR